MLRIQWTNKRQQTIKTRPTKKNQSINATDERLKIQLTNSTCLFLLNTTKCQAIRRALTRINGNTIAKCRRWDSRSGTKCTQKPWVIRALSSSAFPTTVISNRNKCRKFKTIAYLLLITIDSTRNCLVFMSAACCILCAGCVDSVTRNSNTQTSVTYRR